MFKKIILSLSIFLWFTFCAVWAYAECKYDGSKGIDVVIWECLNDDTLVDIKNDENLKVVGEIGVTPVIQRFIWIIANILAVGAIGAIAFGWFSMVTSGWEEEKLKKAKDIIKWAVIGLIGILLAEQILGAIKNLITAL